ncbi:MAG: LysR family transcriptional regulator [Ruminococcus sp.]|nr:LysR family transcriptional regulator [Oscillospiraceae bacterium]MDY4413626.1 LysR family transcriptional regulator [Ruminococcus sp.]
MDFMQIKYFLEVAESQHVTNSAKKLHIAQPALTKSIHKFESELGVPLFTSKGRNIILTEYGKFMKQKLEPLMEKLEDIPNQLRTKIRLENETIHLNVLSASTLITDAIIKYKNTHKNINFQLFQNSDSDLYDIGITTKMFYKFPEENAKDKFVCTEKIYLAVPDNEKYHGRTSINLEEVRNEGFISLLGSKQMRWICDKLCQNVGFQPRIIFESDNLTSVKNMIGANIGIGFWPEHTWGKLEGDSVLLLEISNPVCQRDILFTCNHNKSDNSNVEEFFEFLREYTESVMK